MSKHQALMWDYLREMYEGKKHTLIDRFHIYQKYVNQLGFESAFYTFVTNVVVGKTQLPSIILKSDEYSVDFLDHYVNGQLDNNDFTIRRIKANQMEIMDWREHEQSGQLSRDEEKVILLAREDYGVSNSLSMPLMNQSIGGAGVSINSSENDSTFTQLKSENLGMAADVFYAK